MMKGQNAGKKFLVISCQSDLSLNNSQSNRENLIESEKIQDTTFNVDWLEYKQIHEPSTISKSKSPFGKTESEIGRIFSYICSNSATKFYCAAIFHFLLIILLVKLKSHVANRNVQRLIS